MNILVPLANGVEEMETVIVVDILRRAGIDVTTASLLDRKEIYCSRKIVLIADELFANVDYESFDGIVLPGGMDAANAYKESEVVGKILKYFETSKKLIAVICASPIALSSHNIHIGKRLTSHPSVSNQLSRYIYSEDKVVVDDKLITSRAPGTAFDFSLEIVRALCGNSKVEETKKPMLL